MSTKIYNGKKMPLMDLKEFYEFIKNLRVEATEVADEYVLSMLLNKSIEVIDKYFVFRYEDVDFKEFEQLVKNKFSFDDDEKLDLSPNKDGSYNSLRSIVFKNIMGLPKRLKASLIRDLDFDLYFKINFFILNEKILMIPYYEQSFYEEILDKQKGVECYAYQNSTDKFDDVSQEEWDLREDEWGQCLSGNAFDLKGIVIDIVDDERVYYNFTKMGGNRKNKNLEEISHSSYEERMFNLAKDRVSGLRMKEGIKKFEIDNPGKKVSGSVVMPIFMDFSKEFKENYPNGMVPVKRNEFTEQMDYWIKYFKKIIPDVNVNSYIKMQMKPWEKQLKLF